MTDLKKEIWTEYNTKETSLEWWDEQKKRLAEAVGENEAEIFFFEMEEREDEFSLAEKEEPSSECDYCSGGIHIWDEDECHNENCTFDYASEHRCP